jgi:glycosyltransferase involved in cell wall biosynthesis
VPFKDHDMLLDAASNLAAAGVDFELDQIGEDISRTGAVARRAVDLGLADRIRFHGFLPHRQMRPFFDRADLLIVTSRHEEGPLVVLEAAVAGVPTVGTSVGHLAEWAPLAARVVPPRDSTALARTIIEVLFNDTARLGLAARAQAIALDEDADETARRFREVYAELAGAAGRKGRPGLNLHRTARHQQHAS